MSFDSEILKKTLDALESARRDRQLELCRRTLEMQARFPRLAEIESERKLLGLSIAGNVLSGGDTSAALPIPRNPSPARERKAAPFAPPADYLTTSRTPRSAETFIYRQHALRVSGMLPRRQTAAFRSLNVAPALRRSLSVSLYSDVISRE